MLIKQFRSHRVRVQDPLRPGRYAFEERLIPTGATGISHEGESWEPDDNGWFDVPLQVGQHMLRFHAPGGERFLTDADVGEHVGVGAIDVAHLPDIRPTRRKSAKATA